MDKYLKLIIGLLVILAGAYTYVAWPGNLVALWTIVKGSFGLGVILIGLIFVLLGLTE
ncbi:hypothetical protein J4442_01085 [Candidatus Woesearchaeota archaeon]|nr:hypothetical protein [Candidatus Woesearchaeota archaeon]